MAGGVGAFPVGFFKIVVLVATFCPIAPFEAVLFTATAVLLRVTNFASVFFIDGDFLAAGDFAPAFVGEIGRVGAGEALDELLAATFTRTALPAAELFAAGAAASVPGCRAHRARCAAAILAFPSGLMVLRFGRLNSLGSMRVALLLDPSGRPRLAAVLDATCSLEEPIVLSPPSKLRACVRRAISPSINARISVVFIRTRIRDTASCEGGS